MDNLFEILIYLFIIFSIFSPLFKKKGQKPTQQQEQQSVERDEVSSAGNTVDQKQAEYDILQEIEKMFKTDTSPPPEIKEKQTIIEKKEGKKQTPIERMRGSEPERQKVPSEHQYTDWTRRVQVDDAITKKAAQFNEMMERKKRKSVNEDVLKMREKIRNPQALKDYIIFAEILGKPKALRR